MDSARSFSNITRRYFLRTLAAIPAAIPAAATVPIEPDYSPVIETVKRMLPIEMAKRDILGAAIAIIDDEKVVWSHGFGHTDVSRTVPVTPDTLFLAGSISKSITALAALWAADRGLLDLDDPVQKILKWFTVNSRLPEQPASGITIRHLLSHHSGLGTWSPYGNPSDPQYHRRTFEEVVRSTTGSCLKFPPGARFEYSNQGINLAGYAVAVAAGKSFIAFMRDEILEPIGMTTSTFDQEAVAKETRAVGYMGNTPAPSVDGVVHPLLAAGGMLTSANDLGSLIVFHLRSGVANGKQVISQQGLREMYKPQFTSREQPTGYGLGIYNALQQGTTRLSHGGLGYGISTHYRWLPEHRIGVVLLTNQSSAHNAPALAGQVSDLLINAKGKTQRVNKSVPVNTPMAGNDEASAERLAGTYLLYDGILAQFRFEKGGLFHLVGRDKVRLYPHSMDEFVSGDRRYKFILSEGGRPKGVTITDPNYDPQTAENSVLFLAANDSPSDRKGPDKPGWRSRAGNYTGTFIGAPSHARISMRNGYLYLDEQVKLSEFESDYFTTADGDAVTFQGPRLSVGNLAYEKRK